MAKKKANRTDGFNMSEEIRNLLTEDKSLSSREVFEALQKNFPGQEINRNSCNVAFSQARRRLGIKKGRSSKAVRKPGAARRGRAASVASAPQAVDLPLLKSASKFLAEAGSSQTAIAAIQQVASLQINQ
ncbi:MAG: hypothetical protein KDA80_22935 [Planctomycetaceae bacterium]|nr:hypothetical protein [Planctomycetaceae bacterium]